MSAKKPLRFAPHTCPASVQRIKWEICVLCQDHGGTLIRPAVQAGYTPLHEINSLPLNSEISRLNDGKVWRKLLLPILLNGIKPAMFFLFVMRPESEKRMFPKNFLILQCKQHLRSTSTPSRSMKTRFRR